MGTGPVGPALAVALLACGVGERPSPAAVSTDGRAHAQPRDQWTVRLDGVGPVRYGMPAAEARAALGDTIGDQIPADHCLYLVPAGGPPGLKFMIKGGKVVRADVDSAGARTGAGVEVGTGEPQVRSRYPAAVIDPHKYDTGGRYLVVRDPADSMRRLVFETDGKRVVRYRAGVVPPVEYVEGCG